MNRWTLGICGIAVLGLLPVGPNEFARGVWGIPPEGADPQQLVSGSKTERWAAEFSAASEFVEKSDFRSAARLLARPALEGHVASQVLLGKLYFSGQGVDQDSHEAVRLWRLAAEHGNIDAQMRLAAVYELGAGVERDLVESFRWTKAAALSGDPDGQFFLGNKLYFGVGVAANQAEGERWLVTAAKSGSKDALALFAEAGSRPSGNPAQDWAANQLASGRPMSLREMSILSEIAQGRAVSNQPTYGKTSIQPMSPPTSVATMSGRRQEGGYRGVSGATYQYDLTDPVQRLRYETDPRAQMNDSISVDPRRELDRSTGQYGGGIKR